MTCIEHFAPAALRKHVFSLSGVYLLLTVPCKSVWLCKGQWASNPPVQVLLSAFKPNFWPFTSKSPSFLKPALRADRLSDTRSHTIGCAKAQTFFALRKGREMPFASEAGASLGLAVRWQRQDPCSYLCATFSGWTLWLMIPPVPLCAAAWPWGFLLLLDGGQSKPARCFPSCLPWSVSHALRLWHLPGWLVLVFCF